MNDETKLGARVGSNALLDASERQRVVCQFSCGAASAVATKLAIAQYGATHEIVILNAFLESEHPDNRRFADDCERWFGMPITVCRDEKYGASVDVVFERVRWMNGQHGASCSSRLKRQVLGKHMRAGDINVFGFTIEEVDRLMDRRAEAEPMGVLAVSPLIEQELTKDDCKAMVLRAGIELPYMYRKGYSNANCPGCVKGGEGYWRAIDADFPEVYERRMAQQEAIGPGSYFFRDRVTQVRFGLKDLRLKAGRVDRGENMPACSFYCEAAERNYAEEASNAILTGGCAAQENPDGT